MRGRFNRVRTLLGVLGALLIVLAVPEEAKSQCSAGYCGPRVVVAREVRVVRVVPARRVVRWQPVRRVWGWRWRSTVRRGR